MKLLLYSVAVFLLTFGIHSLVWFIRAPARPYRALLTLFTLGGLAAAGLQTVLPDTWTAWYPHGFWPWTAAGLFHLAGTLSYIIVYSALEQDRPSATMVKFTDLAGPEGRAPDEFSEILTDDLVIHTRLQAMVAGRLACRRDGRCRLTPKGVFWERLFGLWMKWLGIRENG